MDLCGDPWGVPCLGLSQPLVFRMKYESSASLMSQNKSSRRLSQANSLERANNKEYKLKTKILVVRLQKKRF
jgi:hypothetical protein